MNRKNYIYLGLIALGLLALWLDRSYFGVTAPSKSTALEADRSINGAQEKPGFLRQPAPRIGQRGTGAAGVPELRFPRNLPPFAPDIEIRDIFARADVAKNYKKGKRVGPEKSGDEEEPEGAVGREQFVAKHTLGAVMVMDGLKIAVLDGRWLRVGDIVDTCRLVQIGGDAAVFECHDGNAIFSMKRNRIAR